MFSTILTSIGFITFSLQGQQTNGYPAIGIPGGTILLHTGYDCPPGYEPMPEFAGRSPVGVGNYTGYNNLNISEPYLYLFNETGGSRTHINTEEEMASHTHINGVYKYIFKSNGLQTSATVDNIGNNEPNLQNVAPMLSAGEGQQYDIQSPFFTTLYCKKISDDNTTNLVTTDDLNQVIQPINNNLTDVIESLNGTRQQINTLEQNSNNNNQQINVITQNITSISEEVYALNQRLEKISNTEIIIKNGVNDSILYTKEQGEAFQKQVNSLNTNVSALMSIVAEKDGQIENLETTLNNTREELAQANQRINAIVEQLNNSGADASTIAAWTLTATMTAMTLAVLVGCICKMRRDSVAQQDNRHNPMRIQSISSYPNRPSNSVVINNSQKREQYNMDKRPSNIEMEQRNPFQVTFGGGNDAALNDEDIIALSELKNIRFSNEKPPISLDGSSKKKKKDDFLDQIKSHNTGMDITQNDIFAEMNDENNPALSNDDKEGIIIPEQFSTNSNVYSSRKNPSMFGGQNNMNDDLDDDAIVSDINKFMDNNELTIKGDDEDMHTAGKDNIAIPLSTNDDANDNDIPQPQEYQYTPQ